MMKKVVLSICMMIKNEEKNLKRCLDSLQVLRESIPSELIIVDTGSDDNSISIAQEYTDKVYFHPWNDDFSAMRNISINYAAGEWVLIIDADEEMVENKGILELFKKKIPTEVAGAYFQVKNLTSSKEEDARYTVPFNSTRIFRKTKEFHYEGIVHNIPIVNGVLVEIPAMLLHYGYIADDPELMERKFQRTATLLKRKLDKEPDDIYYRFQLANSFGMHGDHLEAFQEVQKAYKLCKSDKELKKHIYVVCLLLKEAVAIEYTSDEILKDVQRGLSLEPDYFDLYFYLGQFYALRLEDTEAITCFEKYFITVENFPNTTLRCNLTLNHYSMYSQTEALYNMAAIYGRMGNYIEANCCLNKILKENEKAIREIGNPLLDVIRNCAFKTGKFAILLKAYNLLNQNAKLQKENEHKIEYDWIAASDDVRSEFSLVMKDVQNDYGVLNYLRSVHLTKWTEKEFSLANQLIEKEDFAEQYWYSWLGLAYWKQEMANRIIDHSAEGNVLALFTYLDKIAKTELIKICQMYLTKLGDPSEASYQEVRRGKLFAKYLLFSQKWGEEEYENLFAQYSGYGMTHLKMLYTPFVINSGRVYEMKSVEEAFFAYLILANNDDLTKRVEFLKKAALIFPEMGKGVRIALEEIAAKTLEQKVRKLEMEELKKSLLKNIIKLIDENKYSEALQAIEEVEKIVGVDAEILMLKTKILIAKQ